MRFILLTTIAASTSLAALGFDSSGRPMRVTQSACEMDAFPASRARSYLRTFLTDTGEVGERFAERRQELGVVGVRYEQVVVVQDTVKCRAALNAWKALYASFRPDLGADAALIDGGMLFRLTPNRFILATPLPNKYSGITYLALDSNAVIVRNNL